MAVIQALVKAPFLAVHSKVKENGEAGVGSGELPVILLGGIWRSSPLEGGFFIILASGVNAGIGSLRGGRLKLVDIFKVRANDVMV